MGSFLEGSPSRKQNAPTGAAGLIINTLNKNKEDCSHEEDTANGAAERRGTKGGAERGRGFPRKPDPGRCRQCHCRVGGQRHREDHEQDEDRVPEGKDGKRGIRRIPVVLLQKNLLVRENPQKTGCFRSLATLLFILLKDN